jgi:TonB-dependent receptor
MPSFLRFLFALVCSLLLFSAAQAQTDRSAAQGRKGTISGHVTDTSGGVLQGAEVLLEAQDIKVVSDVQGQFFIRDLEPGNYSVSVTYVGFARFSQTVNVIAGQVATVDAKLAPESQNLEVLVTAERPSAEAEAVNRERSADNILQVLPADVIRSLPNANMADALGRLPSVTLERDEGEGKYVQVRGTEPRLTNTTIDGVNVPSPESQVRQIKFDAIPADIVESVEINKTLQANMDGDGIGGSINLVTKTAGERPTISLGGMGGYMPIMGGRGQYESAGTIGQRFGAQKRLGALFGGTYDWSGRGIDDLEPIPDVATNLPGQPVYFAGTDLREYRYYRSRWGLAGSADYKLAEGSNIYLRGLFSDFKNYGDRWAYTLVDNTPNAGLYNSNGGTPSFNSQIRRPDYLVSSMVLGGKHVLTSTWYAWDVSASRSRQVGQVGDQGASFAATNLPSSACQFDPASTKDIHRPQWLPVCFTEAFNPSNYTLSGIFAYHGHSAQLNLQATGAMAKRYHLGSHLSNFEFGGKFRNAHKFDDTYNVGFTPTGTVPLTQFPIGFTGDNYYGGTYKFGPSVSYQPIGRFLNSNPNAFTSVSTNGTDPANYGLIEKVSAGYLMNTIDFSTRVRVVAGVRFEGTSLSGVNRFLDMTTNPPTITPNSFNGSYVKVLHSVSLRYSFTGNTNLRFVYGRGFSRPDPVEIAQAETFTTSGPPGNLKNNVSLGNPNLRAETADNFDVLIERYLNPFGMISAGYFYKRLTDPIVTQTFVLQNFQPAPTAPKGTYTATQPINIGSAWISGFEAAYLQHLTFLPGGLGGLGISANYGYTASQANGLPGRADHPRLLRNAPNTWNISPTYDRGRFSIRAGLSYNQANIYSYKFQDGSLLLDGVTHSTPTPGGLNGPLSDIYFYSHLQVDAQGSVRLAHGLDFIMYGLNLTNEVFGFYQGSQPFMIQREFYTPTIAAGFRWSPLHEK